MLRLLVGRRLRQVTVAAAALAAGACALALSAHPTPVHAAGQVTWIHVGDGFWDDGSNWSTGKVPGLGDDVVINMSGPVQVTFRTGSISINGLTVANRLVLVGGTLNIAAASTVPGRLEVAGGILGGGGTMTVGGSLGLTSGTLAASTIIQSGGGLDISGDTQKRLLSPSFDNRGSATWSGKGDIEASGSSFINQGTFTITNDSCFCGTNSQFINNGTGVVVKGTTTGTTSFAGRFSNQAGVVRVQTGDLALNGGGTGTGSFDVAGASTLRIAAGHYTMDKGAALQGAGYTQVSGGTLTIADSLDATNLILSTGGILDGTGTLTVSGQFNWTGGTMAGTGTTQLKGVDPARATLSIAGPDSKTLVQRTIVNQGDIVVADSGSITMSSSSISNQGTFTAVGDQNFNGSGVSPSIYNYGSFTKSAGTSQGTNFFGVLFNTFAGSSVSVQSGWLRLGGGGEGATAMTIDAGATTAFTGGTFTFSAGSISGPGTALITGGTFLVPGISSIDSLELSGGILEVWGVLTVNNTMIWSGGRISSPESIGFGRLEIPATASLSISSPSPKSLIGTDLVNRGSVVWGSDSGDITGTLGAIKNQDVGTFEIQNDRCLCSARFENASGTLSKTAGTGTSILAAYFNSLGGSLSVQTGTLELHTGSDDASSTYTTFDGANLDFARGRYSLSGSISGLGTARVRGSGELAVNGNQASVSSAFVLAPDGILSLASGGTFTVNNTMTWTGGTLGARDSTGGTLAIANQAILTMSGLLPKRFTLGRIANAGTTTWTDAGDLAFGANAVFENQAGGNFQVLNNRPFGAFILNNAGTLTKSSDGTTTFGGGGAGQLNNTGTINVQSGFLVISSGGASTGLMASTAPAGVIFDGTTTYELRDGAALTGPSLVQRSAILKTSGSVAVEDLTVNYPIGSLTATLVATGAISGQVTNMGTFRAPGEAPFVGLSISGGFTQTDTGVFMISIGGTGSPPPCSLVRTVTVSGPAVLAGTLLQSGSCNPYPLQALTFLTATSISGTLSYNSNVFNLVKSQDGTAYSLVAK